MLFIIQGYLGYVTVQPPVLALHVIFLNQPLNIPLDIGHGQDTAGHGCFDRLRDQLLMANCLATLHDPHDSSLALEVAVFCDTLVRLLVLLLSLFQLDLVDLYAVLGV